MMRSGDTPVPIPNTTVKTWAVDGTWWEAAWESRWSPESNMPMWLNWQSSWLVISRLSVRVRSSAFFLFLETGISDCRKITTQKVRFIFSFPKERKNHFIIFHSFPRDIASNVRSEIHKRKMIPLYGWIPERPKGADCKSVAIASKVRILLRPLIRQAEMLVFFCYITTRLQIDWSCISKYTSDWKLIP